MSSPVFFPRDLRRLARSSLVLLLVIGSVYALLGDELLRRIGAGIDSVAHRVSDATTTLRLRATGSSLDSSNESFEQLLDYRVTLIQQIQTIQEQQEVAAGRLRADKHLLRNILGVLEGKADSSAADLPRAVVEQDASVVLGRVQAHQSEINRCSSLLHRMKEDLAKLEQEIEKTRCSLRQKLDDLERQKATFAAGKAYRDGLDLARELDDGDR